MSSSVELSESMAIAKLVRKLQRHICNSPEEPQTDKQRHQQEDLTQYILQILSSLDSTNATSTSGSGRDGQGASSVHHALDKMEAKLYQAYGSEDRRIHRFQQLRTRFLQSPVFDYKTYVSKVIRILHCNVFVPLLDSE